MYSLLPVHAVKRVEFRSEMLLSVAKSTQITIQPNFQLQKIRTSITYYLDHDIVAKDSAEAAVPLTSPLALMVLRAQYTTYLF
jgi:hypothetical protein